MCYILVHGLGQDDSSWNRVSQKLKAYEIESKTPNLWTLSQGKIDVQILYQAFCSYCNLQNGKLNLCGISLGGILAMRYAVDFPKKVESLVLIGTPYQFPKILMHFQNIIFHLMPRRTFTRLGISKSDFIRLVHTTSQVDIPSLVKKISIPTLILCGEKDKANHKSTKLLYQCIANSQMKVIQDAGHEVNQDNPDCLVDVLVSFWTSQKEKVQDK